jgi:hypothetical protein
MGWVKRVPAWIWLLFSGVQVLRIVASHLLGSAPSAIGIAVSCIASVLFLGLAVCRWRLWAPAEGRVSGRRGIGGNLSR